MHDTYPSKVIFLDIDHVLTNTRLDGSSFLMLDPTRYRLSPLNMRWLDKVLKETNAKIVIASNWRKFTAAIPYWTYNGKKYYSPLGKFKALYHKHIIGMLPPERHTTKSECLELWFEENPWLSKSKGNYVIFEDDVEEGYQESPFFIKHLVLTDYKVGLTEADAERAIAILNYA